MYDDNEDDIDPDRGGSVEVPSAGAKDSSNSDQTNSRDPSVNNSPLDRTKDPEQDPDPIHGQADANSRDWDRVGGGNHGTGGGPETSTQTDPLKQRGLSPSPLPTNTGSAGLTNVGNFDLDQDRDFNQAQLRSLIKDATTLRTAKPSRATLRTYDPSVDHMIPLRSADTEAIKMLLEGANDYIMNAPLDTVLDIVNDLILWDVGIYGEFPHEAAEQVLEKIEDQLGETPAY